MIKEKIIKTIIVLYILFLVVVTIGIKEPKESVEISLGCFKGDCINGAGRISYSPTKSYSGEFKDGKHNGRGYFQSVSDGQLYFGAGTYKNNIPIDITWWKSLDYDGGNPPNKLMHFASGDSIKIVGDYVHSIELQSDENTTTSKTSKYEIDCKNNRFREIESYSYVNSLGIGEATELEPNNTWEKIDTVNKYREHLLHSDICKAYSRAIENNETEIDISSRPLSFFKSESFDEAYKRTMDLL